MVVEEMVYILADHVIETPNGEVIAPVVFHTKTAYQQFLTMNTVKNVENFSTQKELNDALLYRIGK